MSCGFVACVPTGRWLVVFWFWVVVTVLAVPPIAFGLVFSALYLYIRWKYMGYLTRIFQEKPLFFAPTAEKHADAGEQTVRCIVTDGAYGTHTTMVPYLKRWIQIYSDRKILQRVLPTWFYGLVGMVGAKKVARNRGVTYPSVEKAVSRLNRPLLM